MTPGDATAPFCAVAVVVDAPADLDRAMPIAAALAATANLPLEVLAVTAGQPDRFAEGTVAATAGLPDVTWYAVSADDPGPGITEHVGHRDGLVVVLATSVWTSHRAVQLEPLAEHVVAQVRAPVLVIGPRSTGWPGRGPVPIAVVDGSGLADVTLPLTAAWAHTFAGDVAGVVGVVPPDAWPSGAAAAASTSPAEDYALRLRHRGVTARVDVLRAPEAAPALAQLADRRDDAMLLVTSPRWAAEPTHWYGTARRLVGTCIHPVLVVAADLPCPDDGSSPQELRRRPR